MAHAGGRPTKYKKEFCEQLISHMGEGLSFKSFGAVIGVCEETLHDWCRDKPEFSESKRIGRDKQLLCYERLGLDGMHAGKDFNATTFIWMTKNMLHWKDRQEVTSINKNINAEVPISEMVKDPEILEDLIKLETRLRSKKQS